MKCTECPEAAVVAFKWPTSRGPQSAPLCAEHAQLWQKNYGHTPSGLGLCIETLEREAGE